MALGYVRPARPDDVGDIARLQLATWRVAYRRLFPASVFHQLNEDVLARHWLTAIEEPPTSTHRVMVAVEQAEQSYLVGFIAAGQVDEAALAPGEDVTTFGPATVAVTELLVEPRWGRRGHGSRLLAASVDHWRDDGFTTAVAWAYHQNRATHAFLTSAGWEPDGAARALDVDDLLLTQLRLHVAILSADPAAD